MSEGIFRTGHEGKTHDEHLAWCKSRALEIWGAGDMGGAVASMISDLKKHPDWQDDTTLGFLMMAAMIDIRNGNLLAVRRWIEGFN